MTTQLLDLCNAVAAILDNLLVSVLSFLAPLFSLLGQSVPDFTFADVCTQLFSGFGGV
ncbi:MAG: hypothetical protein HUU22_18360 [Phycisphaerae bacterium]|nr:hypothetical protein [Phycisphaerae bacterium]NUQ47980.1 hypothetical protein [Phycisphaerae bacterium]